MKIVVYGLTITSSWGNGHATTYRSLLKALHHRGHRIEFIEKDVEWYRSNRDLPQPSFCSVHLYQQWENECAALVRRSKDADAIVMGSYFPDAIAATNLLLQQASCPIFFYDIDTPITLSKLREHGRTEYLDGALIPQYDAYLSFTGGPALRELEGQFAARRAVAFFCSVDPDLYHPTETRPELCSDLSYLGTYAADRQAKLVKLLDDAAGHLPTARFIVAGPQYPAETVWHRNVERIPHLSPPHHPAFYSSSRFTLNLTRHDMVAAGYSPSVRLFEASACGAAILSDSWAGLAEFLTPGEEVLVPKDTAEVVTILREVSDEDRKRIGARARDRILAEHTAEHRAAEFEEIVSSCS
ncbi:MAG: glycosyltransferase [Acidobacteriota bacterium]|nr:glycosyltransferase [Acidobacteriota bacterium]